jgi:hypothetical protein
MSNDPNQKIRHSIAWENVGLILALFPCIAFVIVASGFALGIGISPLHFPVALILTFVITLFFSREKNFASFGITSGISLLIMGACTWVASLFYDISFDGQWYHSQVVLAIEEGWNPFKGNYYCKIPRSQTYPIWLNHYPNASGYAKATFFSLTGVFESIKAINFLLAIASFIAINNLLRSRLKLFKALRIIIGVLIALNPIVFGELLSNYIDGQLYSLLIIAGCWLMKTFEGKRYYWVFISVLTLYLINLKYTAVFYLVIIFIVYGILLIYKWRFKQLFLAVVFVSFSFALGTFALGYPTYVRNYVQMGHPMFPVMGKDKKDIGKILYPADFYGMNRLEKFIRSNLATTGQSRAPAKSDLRKPFVDFRLNDMYWYKLLVGEISGFGPANAEIFFCWMLGMPLMVVLAFRDRSSRILLGLILVICISVFINPEAWVARYAPQFYLCFIACALALILYKKRWVKVFGFTMLTIMGINLVIIISYYISGQVVFTRNINRAFARMKKSEQVYVRFGFLVSHRQRFKEAHIKFKEDFGFDEQGWIPFPHSYQSTSYRLEVPPVHIDHP